MSQKDKIFEVHPKRPISGILPNRKRIMDVMRLPLSRSEFLRCMTHGTVYAVVGDDIVIVTDTDYDKAMSLFDKAVEHSTKEVKLTDKIVPTDTVNLNKTSFAERVLAAGPDALKVNLNEKPNTEINTDKETKSEDKKEEQPQPIVECNTSSDIEDDDTTDKTSTVDKDKKEPVMNENKNTDNSNTSVQSKPVQVAASKKNKHK